MALTDNQRFINAVRQVLGKDLLYEVKAPRFPYQIWFFSQVIPVAGWGNRRVSPVRPQNAMTSRERKKLSPAR